MKPILRRKKPEGYKELLVYKRATELQDFTYKITENFPINERRRREHMRDSARSVKQNIVEGWKRETTQQYIDFLSFSFGSLGELKEDGEDCFKRGLFGVTGEKGERGEMGEMGERGEKIFEELMRRCGEVDYLMGRLKHALEEKIGKEEVLSPYNKWLGKEMKQDEAENKKFDEELKEIVERAKGEKGDKRETI